MRTGDAVWVHRPEDKNQWWIISDTETSFRFLLKEGKVLISFVTIGLYALTLLCSPYKTEV